MREPLYPHVPKRQPQFPHVPKSQQATEKLPYALPTGTCYQDAWRFVIKEGGTLVHGTVWNTGQGKRIGHAWVETETGYYGRIWEPETKKFYSKLGFENIAAPVAQQRYTAEEAAIMAVRTKHYGPWSEQERRQYLGVRLPQVAPIEGGEPIPARYRHLVDPLPLPEFALSVELLPAVEAETKQAALLRKLKDGVERIQSSPEFRNYLIAMSRFHNYSWNNQLLIMLQRPDAAHVAGFNTWKDLGRWVKRGETGIAIFAPSFRAADVIWVRDGAQWKIQRLGEEWGIYEGGRIVGRYRTRREAERQLQSWGATEEKVGEAEPYFLVVHVFDIAQTEGKPLPEFEVPVLTGEVNEELRTKLLSLMKGRGVKVSFESRPYLPPEVKGEYLSPNEIWVRPEEPPAQQLKTLTHEVAHYYSEDVFRIPKRDSETIAESAAYVIGAHYGFDTGVRSFPYVALWARDEKVLAANLGAIQRVANTILEELEK